MNLALLIFFRELSTLPRRNRFYLKRSVLVILGAIILLWALGMENRYSATSIGLMLFSSLSMSTLFAVCLMSVMSSSALIMREKEERTLGLLFLSDVSSILFVAGKIITSMFSMVITILSLLPLYMLAISLGGVSAMQIVTAFAILLGVIFLGSCIGMFGAAVAASERSMSGLLFLLGLMFFALLPALVAAIWYYFNSNSPSSFLMSAISPFGAMATAIEGRRSLAGFLNAAFCISAGVPFALLSAVILPRKVISREKPSLTLRWHERMKTIKNMRKWVVPDRIAGNPVTWKDFHYWHGGIRSTWLKFSASIFCVLLVVLMFSLKIGSNRKEIIESLFITICIYSIGVFGLGSISHFGMMFNRERKSQAMEILLTTSLSDEEIILGKVKAVFLSILPWLLSSILCVVAMIVVFGLKPDFWTAFSYGFFECISMWFGLSSLAMWVSLRYRKNLAMPVCMVVFMLWNSLGRAMLLPILIHGDSGFTMVVLDVAVFVITGFTALANVFTKFRTIALADADRT